MANIATIHERIALLVQHKAASKNTVFAQRLGVSEANIRGYIKGVVPKADVLAKIVTSYDDINPSWLLTGEGSMLKESPQASPGAPPSVPEASSSPSSRAMKPQKTAGSNADDTSAFLAYIKEQTVLLNEAIKAKDTVIEQKNQEIRALDRRMAQLECDNRHLTDEVARLSSEAPPKDTPAHS